MEFRQLGRSGFKVPALSLGTGTFGGGTEFFSAWGSTGVEEATRLVDICLDAGMNMFDSADIYSDGLAEEILGKAIKGRRDSVIISTKATFRAGPGPNDVGSSRHHLLRAVEAALRRLGTDYIDLFQLHGFDAVTPVEEALGTLDDLVRSGKIRYIGCSNFSGWHLMKSLAVSEKYGLAALRRASGLLFADRARVRVGVDAAGASIKASARSSGARSAGDASPAKSAAAQPKPEVSRLNQKIAMEIGPQVSDDYVFRVVDALDEVAKETGKSVPQIALNWLLQRPSVANVIVGARNEDQLRQNLGAVGWNLTPDQVAKLDASSATQPIYPYWHQRGFAERNPFPTG